MQVTRGVLASAVVVIAAVLVGLGADARAATRAVDLGSLGGWQSRVAAISNRGQVVGYSYLPNGYYHAFSWTRRGGMVDLGTLGGANSRATAVNDRGQVVGISWLRGGTTYHGFSWTRSGGMVDLGTLGGPDSLARAVNDRGQVVGMAQDTSGGQHAALWTVTRTKTHIAGSATSLAGYEALAITRRGEVLIQGADAYTWAPRAGTVDLGTLGGAYPTWSVPAAINDRGMVVGMSRMWPPPEDAYRAFYWTPVSGLVALGTLGGSWSGISALGGPVSLVVNDRGDVAGDSEDATGQWHAFRWTRRAGMADLGTLGGNWSETKAIDSRGDIVGDSNTVPDPRPLDCQVQLAEQLFDAQCHTRAFVWTHDRGMVDLGTLGGTNSWAEAINDHGQIAGEADTASDHTDAVMWAPSHGRKSRERG